MQHSPSTSQVAPRSTHPHFPSKQAGAQHSLSSTQSAPAGPHGPVGSPVPVKVEDAEDAEDVPAGSEVVADTGPEVPSEVAPAPEVGTAVVEVDVELMEDVEDVAGPAVLEPEPEVIGGDDPLHPSTQTRAQPHPTVPR